MMDRKEAACQKLRPMHKNKGMENLMNKWIKPVAFLVILILACAGLSRILSRGETLSEYADSNPGLAYATPSPSSLPDVSPSPENSASAELQTEPEEQFDLQEPADNAKYENSFFYEPLSEEIIARITGISYPVSQETAASLPFEAVNTMPDGGSPAVSYEDLRYLSVLYYDFNGEIQTGELICNKGISQDLLEIFYELFQNEYQIEKISLIDEYNGDDTASMLDNNTSCFNYRIVDGTDHLSKHALGCAIDINPFYNPYVVFGKGENNETYISPAGSEIYADRSRDFPYKIDENDLCYRLFKEHGFTWGGSWNSCKDYQHFQKTVD